MLGNPALAKRLSTDLRVPVIGAPMFIGSTVELLVAQSRSGVIGTMPALNPRSTEALDEAISEIRETLGDGALYGINLVAHRSNPRLEADYKVIEKHKVPIVILALGAHPELIEGIHSYGGLVFNDVAFNRHARKCAELGVDGIIAVASGAGGHTGHVSPFALVAEIREWWAGPLVLGGCIVTGRQVLAAQAMGADFAHIGSPFLATTEANTSQAQKDMIVACASDDVLVSDSFTGAKATFLRPSVIENGIDPDQMERAPDAGGVNIADGGSNTKAWRDIWSAGQGIGSVKSIESATSYIDRLVEEYRAARALFA